MRFEGKVVIVTGASTGLGPIMAGLFAAEGASVVLAARRIDLVRDAAAAIGDAAIAVQTDVTQESDVVAMVDAALQRFGHVDVLMNNAAQPGTDKFIWDQTLDNWNATIAVDLTAAMLCTREVIRRSMRERKTGSIVNFSSAAASTGIPRKSHYCSAKAALRTLTKVVAQEAGPYGIRCNCIVPGGIDTDLYRNWLRRIAAEENMSYDDMRARITAGSALRTTSTVEDIARVALFLASDDARTITGQSLTVDAGVNMAG
jgi:3-oxoacyl-[acyl-carrier protein] reductase